MARMPLQKLIKHIGEHCNYNAQKDDLRVLKNCLIENLFINLHSSFRKFLINTSDEMTSLKPSPFSSLLALITIYYKITTAFIVKTNLLLAAFN